MHHSHKWSGDKVCLCDFISCWPLTVWAWRRPWCKAFNRQGIRQQRKRDRLWPSVAAVLHFSVQQILRSIYKGQMFKAYSSYLRFIGSPIEIVLTQALPWSLSVGLSSNYNHILANGLLLFCDQQVCSTGLVGFLLSVCAGLGDTALVKVGYECLLILVDTAPEFWPSPKKKEG